MKFSSLRVFYFYIVVLESGYIQLGNNVLRDVVSVSDKYGTHLCDSELATKGDHFERDDFEPASVRETGTIFIFHSTIIIIFFL